ncbi:hypothetical protein [Litorimonas haliclonae]|uniref:hypothetical protein n=1 Tax=Litorimonas haliclonae TaxID=2081977 RepID=UPI0039EE0E4D
MPKVVKSVFRAVTSVLGTILSAFIKMPKLPKQDVGSLDATQTIQRRLQNGAPREVLIGRRIVGGVGSFDNSRGVDLETGERISIFSAVPCTAFHKLYMDGEPVTLSGDATIGWATITSHFLGKNDVPRASFRLWLGDNNSGLGADLKTLYPSLWNTYNELTELNDIDDHNGLCLGMLRGVNTNDDIGDEDDPEDQQGKNFIPFRGFPEFRVELSGVKVCDPRNGGIYSDPSTYVYSANSGLVDGQFQHGWFGGENGDKLIAGLGYAGDFEDLLDKDQIEDNADYCDLKEFECHGVVTSGSRQDGQNIRDTFNGILVESLAKIRTVPEGNRPHYGTIDFANYPAARVKRYDEDGYSTEVYNATQTKYIEPLEKFAEKDLPELTKTEWIVEDGGEINYLKQTLPLVANSTQGAKIEKADLFTSRLQANGEIENLPLIPFEDYAVGGTVTLANTDVPAMNGRTWSIEGYAETPEGYINFILREYSALTHDFDETDVPDTRPNISPPRDPDFPPRPFANPGTLATVRLAGVSVIIQESWVEGAAILATKTGSTASIAISSHARHYTDKAAGLDVDGDTLTGLTLNSFYYIFYDDADREGGNVTYQATPVRPTARTSTDNPSRHYVGYVTTPASTGPTTTTGTTATPPTQVPERVPNSDNTDAVGGTPASQILADLEATVSQSDATTQINDAKAEVNQARAQADAAVQQSSDDGDAALSTRVARFESKMGDSAAEITEFFDTYTDADEANALALTNLDARTDATESDISDLYTVKASQADLTAEAQRITTQTSRVDQNEADITSAAITNASARDALSTQINQVSANIKRDGWLLDPTFAEPFETHVGYQVPKDWLVWSDDGGDILRTTNSALYTQAPYLDGQTNDQIGIQLFTNSGGFIQDWKFSPQFVIEGVVYLRNGTFEASGIHIQMRDTGDVVLNTATRLHFDDVLDSTDDFRKQVRFSQFYDYSGQSFVPDVDNLRIFFMGNWTGFGVSLSLKDIGLSEFNIRPATPSEIEAQKVIPLQSTVTLQSEAIEDLEENLSSATFSVSASTGDANTARMIIGAYKDNGDEYSAILFESDAIGFRGANGKGLYATDDGLYSEIPFIHESPDGNSWIVQGNGFGASSDLMRWEGANLGTPDACTRTNGRVVYTTDGEVWQFGEQLGTSAIETSDFRTSDGTVTTTGIGGNGKTKTVTGTARITSSRNYYSSAYAVGTTTITAGSAQVKTERRTTGGSWTDIGTTTNNGEITRTVHPFTNGSGDNYVQETFVASATKAGTFTATTGPTYEARATGTTTLPASYVTEEVRVTISTSEPG